MNMRELFTKRLQVLLHCLGQLYRQPFSTLLAALAIGMALSIPMMLYLLVENAEATTSQWRQNPGLSVYLVADASDQHGQQFAEQLADDDLIARSIYLDKALSLDLFLSSAELGDIGELAHQNPLPGVIEVEFLSTVSEQQIESMVLQLEDNSLVDAVQVDLDWVLRLQAAIELLKGAVWILWILLLAGVTLVIANTIRMSVVTRQDEIEVISLVGGSHSFIRRPFLYMGALYGVFGVLIASLVLLGVMVYLGDSIAALFEHYGLQFGRCHSGDCQHHSNVCRDPPGRN